MLDVFNIPNNQSSTSIFYANGNTWQTWQKPRNCSFVWMMAIGGGGGGGGSYVALGASNNAFTGGGGGAVTRGLFNASLIPDILYIQVGLGGAGGGVNSSGVAGGRSFVSLTPSSASLSGLFFASGGAGAAGGGSVAVAGETAIGTASANMMTLSNFMSTAGNNSVIGVFPTPASVTPLTSQITTAGASGGALATGTTSYSGGSILATSFSPLILGGSASTTSNGEKGGDGYTSFDPFMSTGGAGGGAGWSGFSAGAGGAGGLGSGGGSAGVASPGATGASGGKGGDGLVVIVAF